jgi:hypothetical protein
VGNQPWGRDLAGGPVGDGRGFVSGGVASRVDRAGGSGGCRSPPGCPAGSGTGSSRISVRSSCQSWRARPPRCRRSAGRTRSAQAAVAALYDPPAPPFLTALNPLGGRAEAEDQAKPVRGADSGPDPGSILGTERGRQGRLGSSQQPPTAQFGRRLTTTPRRPCEGER